MNHLILVAVGGACGAVLRHLSNMIALRVAGPHLPWGTLFVNIAGSLAMGLFIGWLGRRTGGSSNELRLLLATGVLGGFTTFSAFSLDFAILWERGAAVMAVGYAVLTVLLSLLAIFAGMALMRNLP